MLVLVLMLVLLMRMMMMVMVMMWDTAGQLPVVHEQLTAGHVLLILVAGQQRQTQRWYPIGEAMISHV